jgi:hypothetical protein
MDSSGTFTDGAEWTRRETGASDHLTDIAFGNGTFVAVGWNGIIVQSDSVEPSGGQGKITLSQPTALDGDVQFTFTATVGQVCEVQATADWVSWTTTATVACTASPMTVTIPGQNYPSRFYRVVKP